MVASFVVGVVSVAGAGDASIILVLAWTCGSFACRFSLGILPLDGWILFLRGLVVCFYLVFLDRFV